MEENKTKVCNKCGKEKLLDEFPKAKGCKDGHRNYCKECKSKQNKKHYEKNKERYKENHEKYYKEHEDEIKEYRHQHYEDHKEEYNKRNRQWKEEHEGYNKKHYEENPHIYINSRNRRRIKEENQGKGITKEQFLECMDFFNWRCAYSNKVFSSNNTKKDRTLDHIISLEKGGVHEIWNLVPMYFNYNSSKQDRPPMDWYKKQDYFSEENLNKIVQWQIYAYKKWANDEDKPLVLITDLFDDNEIA